MVILTKPNKRVHAECTSCNITAFALFNVIKENDDKEMYFRHVTYIFDSNNYWTFCYRMVCHSNLSGVIQ